MSDDTPLFADDTVESAAADAGVAPGELRALIERHQTGMRELPGIDELVYEWRKTLREDPLLFADTEAYYVAVARRIWRQFADAHDMTDAEFEALLSVHDAAVRAAVESVDDADLDSSAMEKLDDDHGMVLRKA
jgi:broad specificity phosphatase PhoE